MVCKVFKNLCIQWFLLFRFWEGEGPRTCARAPGARMVVSRRVGIHVSCLQPFARHACSNSWPPERRKFVTRGVGHAALQHVSAQSGCVRCSAVGASHEGTLVCGAPADTFRNIAQFRPRAAITPTCAIYLARHCSSGMRRVSARARGVYTQLPRCPKSALKYMGAAARARSRLCAKVRMRTASSSRPGRSAHRHSMSSPRFSAAAQ